MKKISLLLVVGVLALGSCRFLGKRVRGNGVIKSEERSVTAFKNVEANGEIRLLVTQGPLQPIKIVGDENILQFITVSQSGEKITIETKEGVNLSPSSELTVYVNSPNYENIEVSGSSDIVGQNRISSTGELSLSASGAGDIEMELDAPKVSAGISGSGSVKLKGQTKILDLNLSGAGHAYCYDLLTETTKVDISGAGSAQVFASVNLKAQVSGAGAINYKGNASVSQQITGAGSVNKVN